MSSSSTRSSPESARRSVMTHADEKERLIASAAEPELP